MKLELTRKPKRRQVGIRLTDQEFKAVKQIAKENKTTIAEVCGAMIRTIIEGETKNEKDN